ncbi:MULTISPECIES: AAA family ATPase [unclassified Rhizobium]|uniref:AAA family ATPase n=1 Tax=unclassified Rhizobium TaxID=2613769 RepID=UPI001FDF8B19|nr:MULTISPECIES: AAA family ATPase [unclassified Rhizobium]MDF0659694.1 AAA family ATPase [Rhizobium sp. BC49]
MVPIPKLSHVSTCAFDEPAVREHAEILHRLATGLQGKFVVSTFFANPTGEDAKGSVISHHAVGDIDGMVDAVMAHASTPNANVYICPNLMRLNLERGAKGAEVDVVAVLALVADMDDDTGRAGNMPIAANYAVESSPGNFQKIVLLEKPLSPGDAKPLAAALKRGANSDHCTMDVSHVWRVPGTLNWPNKKKLERGRSAIPAAVSVSEEWQGDLTTIGDLRTALAPWASNETNAAAPTQLGEIPSVEGLSISAAAAEMLSADDVGDRSGWAASVVERLAFDGLTAEQACAAFLSAKGNWFDRYQSKNPRLDFARIWSKFGRQHEEAREKGTAFAAAIVAKRSATPIVANDNSPPPVMPRPFSIFDWPSSRFVGEPPVIEELVEGTIPLAIPGMIAAMGDTGKSYAALELHRRVSFGSVTFDPPIFGGRVLATGTSVMVTSEDDAGEVHRRLAALDKRGHRIAEGKKLLVVPLPSAGGPQVFWREDRKLGLIETDDFKRLCDQLVEIDDLRLVTLDPLASFAHVQINEDPAAGAFVCASLGALAAETRATVLVAHHMKKTAKPVETLADAREAIRGSTALVDGLRLAYALWPAEEKRARAICKDLGVEYSPNKVVFGGVVKANGAARRIVSTYVRNEFGLLVDRTAGIGASNLPQDDLIELMVAAISAAAHAGQPFTKTGATGLFDNKERLGEGLSGLSRHRIEALAQRAIETQRVVKCLAGGTVPKWLDVPTGIFAQGLGEFRKGMMRE